MRRESSSLARKATLSDVAREAKLSPTVVSAFFRGRFYGQSQKGHTVGISGATRAKIITACVKIGYIPDDPALRLQLYPQTGDVCYMLPADISSGLSHPFYASFANGALARLADENRSLKFTVFDSSIDFQAHPEKLPAPIKNHEASRFLIAGSENLSLMETLARLKFPTIYLSRIPEHPYPTGFTANYRSAVKTAIRHLHDLGHRRIAIAGLDYFKANTYSSRELQAGLAEVWPEVFPDLKRPSILFAPGSGESAGFPLWEVIKTIRPKPTAVYCFDDFAANDVVNGALHDGVRIPADLSVVGTNNDLSAALTAVPLTTIDMATREIGAAAVEEVDLQTTEGVPSAPRHRIFPVNLVVRNSTGPV